RKCQVEQVVASNAHHKVTGVFWAQDVVKDCHIVCVDIWLIVVCGQWPTCDCRVYGFHRYVCTLDQTNLDCSPALLFVFVSELDESVDCAESIWLVCLDDDTCVVVVHVWMVQDFFEDIHCQVEVLVFFHVQVHEGTVFLGFLVQRQKAFDDPLLRTVMVPVEQ